MESFRHNLSPVEVKKFLRTVAPLTDTLMIIFCHKTTRPCPECGREELCHSGAVSYFSSNFGKITHEVSACLHCGYKIVINVLSIEKL
jgi:hypothetical protein